DLGGVLEEAVEVDVAALAGLAAQVVGEAVGRVDDLHGASAEHGGGAGEERAEAPAALGVVDRLDARAEQRHAGLGQPGGELQGGLPAELHDHTERALDLDDGEHVVERERLEVEAVGGVVVGGDGLGVAVDHDGVAPGLAHGHGGVHAAVVELDSLPDAVGAGAEDHDGLAIAATDLVNPTPPTALPA